MEPRLRSRGSASPQGALRRPGEWAFNGAAAAKPRKRESARTLCPRLHPSMEPRLRSRGSGRKCAIRARHSAFNGAAAAKPRKLVPPPRQVDPHLLPSMEPRLRSRGSLQAGLRHRCPTVPSMEPRLRSRGSTTGPGGHPCAHSPSMEPRLRSRGSAANRNSFVIKELQPALRAPDHIQDYTRSQRTMPSR